MSASKAPRTAAASARAHEFIPYVSVVEDHVCAEIESELEDKIAEIERLRIALCRILRASRNSMSSKEECGKIAREALKEPT